MEDSGYPSGPASSLAAFLRFRVTALRRTPVRPRFCINEFPVCLVYCCQVNNRTTYNQSYQETKQTTKQAMKHVSSPRSAIGLTRTSAHGLMILLLLLLLLLSLSLLLLLLLFACPLYAYLVRRLSSTTTGSVYIYIYIYDICTHTCRYTHLCLLLFCLLSLLV